MARTEVTGSQIKDGTVSLTADVVGILPVANGGSGSSTLALNNVLLGNGTGALQAVAPGTTGNVLTSNGTSWVSSPNAGGGGDVTLTGTQTLTNKTLTNPTINTPAINNATALSVGNSTSAPAATPANINLGGTYGSTTAGSGSNQKVILYDGGGTVAARSGLGISASTQEYTVPTSWAHRFYVAGTERLTVTGSAVQVGGVDVVTTTGAQTLTNKSLTSPTITGTPVANFAVTRQVVGKGKFLPGTVIDPSPIGQGDGSISIGLHNDLAYLIERGGTGTITQNGTSIDASGLSALFKGSGLHISAAAVTDVFVIEVTKPPTHPYGAFWQVYQTGINFRAGFVARSVKIEHRVNGVWTTSYDVTGDAEGVHYVKAGAAAPYVDAFRFTLTDFQGAGANLCRIQNIWSIGTTANPAFSSAATNFLPRSGGDLFGSAASAPSLQAAGGDANIPLNLYSKGTGAVVLRGTNGISLLANTAAASSVNYVQATGNVTGSRPYLQAGGSDTNIDLDLFGKGTGIVRAGGVPVVTTTGTQSLTNKTLTSPSITTPTGIVKGDVGLGNVDNTSDANKPVSTATSTALSGKEPTITAGTTAQYYRGDKSFQTLNQDAVPSGTTNKVFTATQETKLAGVATGATANSTDATLLARTNHTGTQLAATISDFSTAVTGVTGTKGAANGYASLDSGGKVPVAQLPNSIMEYQGTWNASTNTPTLANGTGSAGDVYRVSVAGTALSLTFEVGDYIIYNGSTWEKSDTTVAEISDSGVIGRELVQAETAASARATIGATATGSAVVTAANAAAARSAISAIAHADTVGTDDALPYESSFWWMTEPVAVDGRVYNSTCGVDNGTWLQEWTQPVDDGPLYLHRYFLGWSTMGATGKEDYRDDHVNASIAVKAGKPLVAFWSSHGLDNRLLYRISDQNIDDVGPGELTFGPTQVLVVADPNRTTYAEVMIDGDDIWVAHRTGFQAIRWSLTKFPDWATGTPVTYEVFSSADQFYMKTRMVSGSIRCMVSDHPNNGTDNKIWYAEINTSTGSITTASGTVLGNLDGTNLPLAQASLQEVFTSSVAGRRPWGFDVGYNSTRELVFSDGNPANFSEDGKYRYARWNGTSWVVSHIADVGNFVSTGNGSYFPSITFVPGAANQVLLARGTKTTPTGTHFVEKYETANSGVTWTLAETIDSSAVNNSTKTPRLALTRAYPVRVESGTTPFDVIGHDIQAYPNYYYGWKMFVRPLPLSLPVKRVPGTDAEAIQTGLRADLLISKSPQTGVYLPGTSGNFIQGPNVAVPSTGLRLEVDLSLPDWDIASAVTLFAKEESSTKREARIMLSTKGAGQTGCRVGFGWSENGSTAKLIIPNDVINPAPGQRVQIAITFVPTTVATPPGAAGPQYYFSSFYRYSDTDPWTPLAVAQLTPATTLFSSNSQWEIGSRWGGTYEMPEAVFHRASLMTRGGETLAEWRADRGGATQKDLQGNTWVTKPAVPTISSSSTLTNKTIALGSNTVSGTLAQFNTAVTDADLARTDAANTFTGVQTMTSPALTTPVITGIPTGTGVATAGTANTLALRDANANITADNFVQAVESTVAAGGTTTLTIASAAIQVFTSNGSQTLRMPTTDVVAGQKWTIINQQSTGSVAIQSSTGAAMFSLPAGYAADVTCLFNTPTTALHWRGSLWAQTAGVIPTTNNSLAAFAQSTSNAIGVGTIELGHASDTTLSRSAAGTLAVEGVVVPTISSAVTLTNKTIALGSNTVSGTLAQFNTAVTDADLVSLAGTETLTNKTIQLPRPDSIYSTDGSLVNTFYIGNSDSGRFPYFSPVPKYLWHDILRFSRFTGAPTYETYDGTAWTSQTLNTNILSGKEATAYPLTNGTTTTGARWTWNSVNLSYSYLRWWVIGLGYVGATTPINSFLVESSANGTTWTTRHTSTVTSQAAPVWLYATDHGADPYLRLTIVTTSAQGINLSGIKGLSSRWANQGGGVEYEFPYDWDGSRNITTLANLTVGIPGTSAGSAVTIDATQTLTNKTLTSPVINGTLTGTGVATAATPSTLALRDANANLAAKNFVNAVNSTATAAGTTTLTIASGGTQVFTGTTTQTVLLPTTGIVQGQQYTFINNSTGAVTVQPSGGVGTVTTMLGGGWVAIVTATADAPTTTAHWTSMQVAAGTQGVFPASGSVTSTTNAVTLTNKTIALGSNTVSGTLAQFNTAVTDADLVSLAGTETLTNKRITPRVVSVASSATPAINTDNGDVFNLTSLATNVTSMTTSLTGTPIDGQRMTIRVKSAAAQTITWGASFASSGAAMLPTTTVAGATHRLDFLWDAADSDWVCVGSFHKTYSSPPTRMGSGITVNRTATGLASLSSGENIFPLGWFGNVVRSTDDLTYDTSGTNTGKVTVSVEGWYQCTLSCAAGLASANGGSLYSILWTGSGAGARSVAFYGGQSRYNAAGGTAPSLNGSFIIYLKAGDYVEPGYYSNVAVSNTLGNTSSDFTSKTTWFSVALINRSHS